MKPVQTLGDGSSGHTQGLNFTLNWDLIPLPGTKFCFIFKCQMQTPPLPTEALESVEGLISQSSLVQLTPRIHKTLMGWI